MAMGTLLSVGYVASGHGKDELRGMPTGRVVEKSLNYGGRGLVAAAVPSPLLAGGWNMARKILNRKELREEVEAAEAREALVEAEESSEKKGKTKAEKKTVKRKSRSKTAEPERRKLFWGVFNQAGKRIALFDFTQRKAAEAKAKELSESGKNVHFVMKVKEAIVE